jgi:hypothetical protein
MSRLAFDLHAKDVRAAARTAIAAMGSPLFLCVPKERNGFMETASQPDALQ